jgi:flagellar biogenesis protein FliO
MRPGGSEFPQLPLKRDGENDSSLAGSAGWAVVFLLVLAGVGLVVVRQRKTGGAQASVNRWFRRTPDSAGLQLLSQSSLTAHASVHVVCWHDEELLVACTRESVTVLARRPANKAQQA